MKALVDTSFIIALSVGTDINHAAARAVGSAYKGTGIVPEVVLSELFHVISKEASHGAAVKLLSTLRKTALRRASLLPVDLARMDVIFENYAEHHFDFTDAAILALAERLKIETIFTFSRSAFSIYKPTHCDQFTLLP